MNRVLITRPTAKISVKKSVLKHYESNNDSVVYLKNGTEFEIELYNPTQDEFLCKFKINGKKENDGGIVIYPGQRLFIERYLDRNKKFKFTTYDVEKDNPSVDYATLNNGLVEITFHKKTQNITWGTSWTSSWATTWVDNTSPTNRNIYIRGANNEKQPLTTSNSNITLSNDNISCYNTTNAVLYSNISESSNITENFKKTGFIEDGSKSEQEFENIDIKFDQYPAYISKVKILPSEERIYDSNTFRHKNYCSNCGKKVNQKDKFCSNCGNKL